MIYGVLLKLCELKVVNLCSWRWNKNACISIGQDEQSEKKASDFNAQFLRIEGKLECFVKFLVKCMGFDKTIGVALV